MVFSHVSCTTATVSIIRIALLFFHVFFENMSILSSEVTIRPFLLRSTTLIFPISHKAVAYCYMYSTPLRYFMVIPLSPSTVSLTELESQSVPLRSVKSPPTHDDTTVDHLLLLPVFYVVQSFSYQSTAVLHVIQSSSFCFSSSHFFVCSS